MTTPRLKMAYGNWVQGDRFWGRDNELQDFIARIDAGAHQILIAQRRMGKTSLMQEAARRLHTRYLGVFVDLEKCFSPADVIVELGLGVHPHRSLWKKLGHVFGTVADRFRDNVESVELGEIGINLRAGLTGEWQRKGDKLMSVLAETETPVLLLIDEAPIAINRILKGADYRITPERRQEADALLSWLRENSLRHQEKIRIVLSGSIGLEPILRQGRLSATLNNFEPFELRAWDEDTARRCLEALAAQYGVEFEAGATAKMVGKLGCCIPHHVQMFFRHAHDWWSHHGRKRISSQQVEAIYRQELLSIHGHAELTHYEERLKLVLGDDLLPLALELLTETAVVGRLTAEAAAVIVEGCQFCTATPAEARRQVLEVLEHDGYLQCKRDCYRFVSKLLRDWWKARNRFAYVPASKRGV